MKVSELKKLVKQEIKTKVQEAEPEITDVPVDTVPEEEPENESSSSAAFVSIILESATQAHIYHLQSDSYAQHMALCAYYNDIPAIIDALAELLQGRYGIIKGYSTPNPYAEDNNPVAYFENLLKSVDAARDTLPADSNIQNSVDNVVDLIQSTLYKLTFLK
ncbi:MAG: DUF5856 family protein [Sediminibacterium sp.]